MPFFGANRHGTQASVILAAETGGDPTLTDRGLGWWSPIGRDVGLGVFSDNADGESQLEYHETLKLLCCRPFLRLQDTQLGQWTAGAGSWQQQRPAGAGPGYKLRLWQSDTTPNRLCDISSNFNLPRNPHVAFVLGIEETPPDHDVTTYPPFVRIVFGDGQWCLEFSKTLGPRLRLLVSGTWVDVQALNEPVRVGNQDNGEFVVFLRYLRGTIAVSTDAGGSYSYFGKMDDYPPLAVLGGNLTVQATGNTFEFGLAQLEFQAGSWDAPRHPAGRTRGLLTAPIITMRAGYNPFAAVPTNSLLFGTNVTATDTSRPGIAEAGFRITLTPAVVPGTPFPFYQTPEYYSATFRYDFVTAAAFGANTTPWDSRLCEITEEKPFELVGGSCKIKVHLDEGTSFSGSYRDRKLQARLAWIDDVGTRTWYTIFTGYIQEIEPSWDGTGEGWLHISAENLGAVLKTEWTPFDVVPLGGLTINQAADYILVSEGLDASYRSWHALGDRLVLPWGTPEEPFELIRPREQKLETLRRLLGYANLELAVTDAGGFASGPFGFFSGTVHSYYASGANAADLMQSLPRISNPVDYRDSATAVLVTGVNMWTGSDIFGVARDVAAETLPASGRFTRRRRVRQEEIPGTTTLGIVAARTQAIALQDFPLKYRPTLTAFLNLDVSRRDQVRLYGCGLVGIPDYSISGRSYVVLTQQRHWLLEASGDTTLELTCGLQLL